MTKRGHSIPVSRQRHNQFQNPKKDTPIDLFWAKVETRIKLAAKDRTQFRYGPPHLDLMGHKVLINGKELLLTLIEFDILCLLSEHLEHVFTPEEIFGMVWGGQPWDGGKMVQTHMSRLRRKLEKAWAADGLPFL